MYEIQKAYGEPNQINFIQKNRKFLLEERFTILLEGNEQDSLIYFLSNMLIICLKDPKQEFVYKYFKSIELTSKSCCSSLPDRKHLQNLIRIIGNNFTLTLLCQNETTKQKTLKLMAELLYHLQPENIIQESQQLCNVFVLGSEEREINTFRQYTVYVIEVSYEDVVQRIYVRYSQVKKLGDFIVSQLSHLKVPHFGSKTWFLNHSSKVIESKKIQIENYLQTLLGSAEFQNSGKYTEEALQLIGLPPNFFKLPSLVRDNSKTNVNRFSMLQINTDDSLNNDLSKIVSPKRNETMLKYGISPLVSPRSPQYTYQSPQRTMADEQICVQVLFHDGSQLPLTIPIYYLAIDLIEHIIEKIKLVDGCDFKLFEVPLEKIEKITSMRPISNDEQLVQIIQPGSGSGKLFSKVYQKALLFRKYLFFPFQYDNMMLYSSDCRTRLKLIVHQVFYEISQGKILFSLKDYCFIVALYLHIKNCQPAYEHVEKIVPIDMLKKQNKSDWVKVVTDIHKQLNLEFSQINLVTNTNNNSNKRDQFSQVLDQMHKFNQNRFANASAMLFNIVNSNFLYGVTCYEINLLKKNQIILKEFIKINKQITFNNNVQQLGIFYHGIHIIDGNKKQIICSWNWEEIFNFEAYSDELIIYFDEGKIQVNFGTKQAFEILNLIWEYQYLVQEVLKIAK